MKISIIIPTYNSGATILDTLESIEKQTYKNLEVIIIDGLSKDNNSKIDVVYISILAKEIEKISELAKTKFPSKKIYFFDAESISYELPNEVKKEKE